MSTSLKDLKVGDSVFVVQQQTRSCKEWRTSTEVISKVGTKYAYWKSHHREYPFHKDTGISAHKELNTRANGYGFDVYTCEEEWRLKLHTEESSSDWASDFATGGQAKAACIRSVKSIHDVLDKWAHDTEGD